jgi:hypothetical protein
MLTHSHRIGWLSVLLAFACSATMVPCGIAAEPGAASESATLSASPSPIEPPASSNPLPDPLAVATPAATPPVTRSQNVTINLINRLVERGVLTKQDAVELIQMAEEDAAAARAQANAAQPAEPPPSSEDTVRVTYVPEFVKKQIREEVKQDVLTQAREENWAAPRTFPEWASRFRFSADLRVRYEGDFFPAGNDNTGAFPNFNAINTGPPFDVRGTLFSPQIDVDQDRERFRLRARFGLAADLGEYFTAGIRIATGDNNSPVTTNQSLGLANQGQGGNFSRYAIWLDRAFLKYELADDEPGGDFSITLGRFDNPFFSSDLIWDDDLGFDGIALQGKYEVVKGVTPFATAGAFPVFNTDFNFSSNRPDKFASYDKYLYGGQLGTDWTITHDLSLKVAAAYYYFQNIEGQLSDPFVPLTAQDAGNTDDSRPAFAQKGNTYFPIRDIIPDVTNNFGTINQFQYFGLATPFRELALTGRVDYTHFEPVVLSLSGEFVKNLAFDRNEIESKAINNRGSEIVPGTPGPFVGGDTGWMVNLRVGKAALEKRWDWNVAVGYRYVETDAVVDGFNDSDFGLGGTNLEGYTISGSVALASRVWLNLRWLSANSIAGPTYKNDIIQFDVNAKF